MERVIPVVIDGKPTLISEAELRNYCALENIPYDSPPPSVEPAQVEQEPDQPSQNQEILFPTGQTGLPAAHPADGIQFEVPQLAPKKTKNQPTITARPPLPSLRLNNLPVTLLSGSDLIGIPVSTGGVASVGVDSFLITQTGQLKIRQGDLQFLSNCKIKGASMEQSAVAQLAMNQPLNSVAAVEEQLEEIIIFCKDKAMRFLLPVRTYDNKAEIRDQTIRNVIRHLNITHPSFISNVGVEPKNVPLFEKDEPAESLVDDPLLTGIELNQYREKWNRVMDKTAKDFKEPCEPPRDNCQNAADQQLISEVPEPMNVGAPQVVNKNEIAVPANVQSGTVQLSIAQPQQPTTFIVATAPRPMATQFIPAPLVVTQLAHPTVSSGVAQIVVTQPIVTQAIVPSPMNPIWVLNKTAVDSAGKGTVKSIVAAKDQSGNAKTVEKQVIQLVEVPYAFCEVCGHNSKDLKTCQKCRRPIPADAKITTMSVQAQQQRPAPQIQSPIRDVQTGAKFVMTLKCTSCDRKSMDKKICEHCKAPIPPNAVAQYFKLITPQLDGKESKPETAKKRKCQRKKKSEEKTETIVDLTEDDDEHGGKVAKEETSNNSTLLPGLDKEPEITEDTISPFHHRLVGGGMDFDEAIHSKDVERATILCRTVRIGSYKTVPEGKVIITTFGITMKIPHVETHEMVDVIIHRYEIIKILANFSKQIPVMFYYTTASCAQRIRKTIGMSNDEPTRAPFYYYNPTSKVEPYRRITLLPEKVAEEPRLFILSTYDEQCLIEVLTEREANNILVTAHPSSVDTTVTPQPAQPTRTLPTAAARVSAGPQPPQQQSQPQLQIIPPPQPASGLSLIQTILVYPPPPAKGGMPINNEDYACLKEDTFLNDVIIDFYLRYFVDHVLPPDERARMHLLSSFFYKRLTMKEPLKPDDSRSPAKRRHDRIRKWLKNVDLFSKDFIVIPINESSHWFLGVICFPGLTGAVRVSDGRPVPNPSNRRAALPHMIGGTTITRVLDTPPIVLDPEEEERDEADADDGDLEPNSSDDEFEEPPEGGTELLDDATHPHPQAKAKAPKEAQEPIKQPCILIFDSLIGGSRAKVCATLREFMQVEYNVKHKASKGPREFTADTMRASVVRVPQQTNFTDCGLYLLQFAEAFFQRPIRDYRMPIKELINWFDVDVVNRKRFQIQQLLHQLMDEQKVDVGRLKLPNLNLDPEGTGGRPGFLEDGDDEMIGMGVDDIVEDGEISAEMDMMEAEYEEMGEEEEDEEMMDEEVSEEELRRYMMSNAAAAAIVESPSNNPRATPTLSQSEDLRNRLVRKEQLSISSTTSIATPPPSPAPVAISSSVSITSAKGSPVTFASPVKPVSVSPSVSVSSSITKPLNQITLTRKVLASSGVEITPTRASPKSVEAILIRPSPVATAKRKIVAQQPHPQLLKNVTSRLHQVPLATAVVARPAGVKKVRADNADSSSSSSSSHASSKDKQ